MHWLIRVVTSRTCEPIISNTYRHFYLTLKKKALEKTENNAVKEGISCIKVSSIPELFPSSPKLDCYSSEEQTVAPELRIICKPYNQVQIHGINVTSDARVIEVYSDIDGYLKSCRGEVINNPKLDDSGQQSKAYNCRFSLEEPLNSILLKFVGLGNKSSFTIHSLHFVLVQSMDAQTGHSEGNIDLNRVRSYLNSMGDAIPENARDLLNSIEQFQQTQMLGLSSIQSALSGPRSPNGHTKGLGMIAGLLSKISVMDMAAKTTQRSSANGIQCCNGEVDKPRENNIHAQNDNKDCELSPLDRLLQKSVYSGGEGHSVQNGDREGQDDMYKMLQGICGSVSAIRQKSQQEETQSKQKEKCEDSQENPTETSKPPEPSPDMNKVIEQTVSQEFEKCEQRLKEYVDTSLVAMETRMNSKLDKMIELLSKSSDS